MRLHRLHLTAFGPYADTATVDFDALSEAGLFLLHGATGAGKTSILDAICFALFGSVPGARHKAQRLRSDHAPADVAPCVVLELTVRGHRLEVTRSPAWQRPKRRGTGTTTEQAKTLLREWTPKGWFEVSQRNDEASKHLIELLGMSAEQFTQVVLLPQGQFAEFLRADAEARRPLLERLFNTAFYSDIEAAVTAQRLELRAQVSLAEQQRRESVARLVESAGASKAVDDLVELSDDELTVWAETTCTEVADRASTLGANAANLRAAEAETVKTRDAARALATRQEQWQRAVAALAVLDEETDTVNRQRHRLARARRADRLRGHLDVMKKTERDLFDAAVRARAPLTRAAVEPRQIELMEAAVEAVVTDPETARAAVSLGASPSLAAEASRAVASSTSWSAPAAGLVISPPSPRSATRPATRSATRSATGQLDLLVDLEATGSSAASDWSASCQEWLRELREAEARGREERARLHELGAAVTHAARAEERRDLLKTEVEAVRAQIVGIEEQLASLPDLVLLEEQLAQLRLVAGEAPSLVTHRNRCADRLLAAQRLQELGLRRVELEAEHRRAVDLAQDRTDVWQRLRQARLDGFAAELASRLVAGDPCAVCGSVEHPAPAVAAQSVGESQESAAEAAATEAAQARVTAERALAELREQMASTRVSAAPDGSGSAASGDLTTPAGDESLLIAAQRDLEEVSRKLMAAESAAADAGRRADELAALEGQREALLARLHETQVRLADREAALSAAVREAAEQLQTVVTVLALEARDVRGTGDLPDLAAAEAGLEEQIQLLTSATVALAAVIDAERAHTSALAGARAAADEAGLQLEEAASGLLSLSELEELEMELSAHDEARAALTATLADDSLAAAARLPIPDVELLEARVASVQQLIGEAAARAAAAESALARCEELRRELTAQVAATAPVRARHAAVTDLAFCLEGSGGGNALRMRLSSFVLAARLEAVAEVASQRLAGISGGRYALLHSDEASGRGRSGLGLKVVDSWTGAERDTCTLSGGETFFVSLALALALADVVMAEAGGVLLETLFIDEGFGSLDEETLDEVMATLDTLREGGRAVGVVSHVADMRQRIPAQIEVRKGRAGSSLVMHGV